MKQRSRPTNFAVCRPPILIQCPNPEVVRLRWSQPGDAGADCVAANSLQDLKFAPSRVMQVPCPSDTAAQNLGSRILNVESSFAFILWRAIKDQVF